jgi:anaerobic ribonucleoside-triphosphate reductase activating protein
VNYHEIEKCSISNGTGFRTVLYVSGCSLHCKGCFNSETWDKNSGKLFDDDAKQELFESLSYPYVKGLTLTGGHPLEPYNLPDIVDLMKEVKTRFPDKDIWVYTGRTMNSLQMPTRNIEQTYLQRVLEYADVIVDGPFIESKKDITLKFRGSSNQNIWVKNDDGEWVNTTEADDN